MVFKHPGLQRRMGNAQKFLTSPHIRPATMQEMEPTVFSRLRRTVSLVNTPPHPRQCCALRQGPCSPAFPQYSIAHISFLQSGIKSSNLIISAQPPRHPLHSAFTAVLESVWQGPPSSGAAQQKEASAQDGLFCSVKQNLAHQTF